MFRDTKHLLLRLRWVCSAFWIIALNRNDLVSFRVNFMDIFNFKFACKQRAIHLELNLLHCVHCMVAHSVFFERLVTGVLPFWIYIMYSLVNF